MDASDVGTFGTISLLRRLPTESVVTSYPIDDEELTIGRDQSCALRLYYPAVSAIHAKITFVDRKAFLIVLGNNGVLLDDEPLYPAAATAPGPTTVPLPNNSVLEIHKKRFRFMYPPKHLRPTLIDTPTRSTPAAVRRPLRLSMIASAQVFTPRPSHDPQENLRVLQTPLRSPFASEGEEIVLVHSNTPRVVEEDKDLVILDEVEPPPAFPLPPRAMPQYPVTPARRPRPSLHRAVLIRSAQRAVLQREIQREDAEDEDEVEETIAAIPEEVDEEVQEVQPPDTEPQVSGWRKSLDMVKGGLGWALRGLSVEPKEEEEEATLEEGEDAPEFIDEHDEEMENEDDHNNDDQENNYTYAEQSDKASRPLGRFMTPQIPRIASQPRLSLGASQSRLSLGGATDAGPRRVRIVAPWKVNEIQVPETVKEEGGSGPFGAVAVTPLTPRSPVKREKLTDEEREAIRQRRRSAVATPDSFFKGQTPGSRRALFPSLAPLPSPRFSQPGQPASTSSATQASAQETPSSSSSHKVEEEEDTAVLLARMKQMAEGVKQRQSLGRQSLSLSPRKRDGGFSLLAPNHASTHRPSRILIEEDDGDAQEDAQMSTDYEGATGASSASAPKTPYMSDLRHLFGRPQGEANTPALAGVRDIFRAQPQGPTETPQMEGMKEMLSTPNVFRAGQAEEEEDKVEEAEDEPVEELPVPVTRGKRTPATRLARRTPVPQSAPPKSTRASSQALEVSEEGEDHHGAHRTRARTADGAVGQTLRATRGKAKPATPEPKDEPEAQPTTTSRATRRTRQTTDPSTSSHTDDVVATDTKPARKTRAKTPTLGAGASTAKAGPARRGTRGKPIEVTEPDSDNDEDPLDSLPRERVATGEAPVPALKGRRGVRTKPPVKQEDVEESVAVDKPAGESEVGTRPTRARRTPVPKMPGGRGTRTRAAAAVPVVESPIPENKENTPEPGEDEEDAKPAGALKAPRGKTARGAKASGNSTPVPDAIEESVPSAIPAPPKTRAGRARATKS